MNKNKRNNKLKSDYDQRMRDKGFVKSCFWHHPDDWNAIQRKCEISREKALKKGG